MKLCKDINFLRSPSHVKKEWNIKHCLGVKLLKQKFLWIQSNYFKKHIFSNSSVYVCGNFCQHNSKINCGINLNFYILHFYHVQMLLETFHEKRTKTLCAGSIQNNSNTLRPMNEISCQFILVHLDCTKHDEINRHFYYVQKHVANRIWYE